MVVVTYRVVKSIKGRRYVYEQDTYRHRGKVKTRSRYIGPVEVVGEPSFSKRVLSYLRSPKPEEDKGLEWAMSMVARLTGRTVEQQLAEMETRYAAHREKPTVTVAATLANATAPVGTSPTAASASAPGQSPNGTSATANGVTSTDVGADQGTAASNAADGDESGGVGGSAGEK